MTTTISPAQLSADKFLYVYTATHVGRLNRRNKLSSPPLEIPDAAVSTGLGYADAGLKGLKLVLLRGVVHSSTDEESEDPVGIFLQAEFDNDTVKQRKSMRHLRCRLSISCAPVRPGGHSHSGGPDDVELTPEDNFKGMRSLLPAVALRNSAAADDSERQQQQPQDEEAERRFAESSPVEFHVTIQFLPPKPAAAAAAAAAAGGSEAKQTTSGGTIDQAASLLGGVASSASATLGSWWGAASAVVSEGKEKVLSTSVSDVKEAFTKAATKAESLAHNIMDRKESTGGDGDNAPAAPGSSSSGAAAVEVRISAQELDAAGAEENEQEAAAAAAATAADHNNKAPWDDIPPSYQQQEEEADPVKKDEGKEGTPGPPPEPRLTPQRWRKLLLHTMVEEDSAFLWAPESAYGVHRERPHHETMAAASTAASSDKKSLSPSRLSQLRPQYPDFVFEPDEELLLSRMGLSANLLLHCNDSYSFDSDVEPFFVDPRNRATAELRQVRLRLVPRVVTEERFWAAYLWRVACLALCTTVEQESVVRTLLRKPVVPVVRAPPVAAASGAGTHRRAGSGGGGGGDSDSDDGRGDGAADNDGEHHHRRRDSSGRAGDSSGDLYQQQDDQHHRRLTALPDVEALAADAEEARGLLDELVEEILSGETPIDDDVDDFDTATSSSPTSAVALFVAALNGVERCRRNTTDAIAALDRVLGDDRVEENWKEPRAKQRDALAELQRVLGEALERGKHAKENPPAQKKKNEKKKEEEEENQQQQEKEEDQHKEAEIASPRPQEPSPAKEEDDDKKKKESSAGTATTTSASPSKSRTPVLMPWEEEDD